jgi:colicin import membrane protein
MGELRDSSLLFSLQSLLEVEHGRVERERAEREQSLLDAQRRREREALQAREEQAARELAERQRESERRQREREEAARLEAIRLAEFERVRLEADHRARLELEARRYEHERELAAQGVSSGKSRLRSWLALSGAALVVSGALAGLYFGKIAPAQRRQAEEQARLVARQNDAAAQAATLLSESKRRQEALENQSESLRQKLRDLQQKKSDKSAPKPVPVPGGLIKRPEPPRPDPNCAKFDPSDPMNPCLR